MKKLTITIILILSNIVLFAQCDESCLPEGITFETQAGIDNFQSNFPGCTEIEGNVLIKEDEITNVNGLNMLTAIGGKLRFYSCSVLASLEGLENLTSIGGDLDIYVWPSSSSSLINLTGLDNLITIGGGLNITGTDVLNSLTGLENVITIGENLQIAGNDALVNLTGLNNLTSIGEEIWIGENTALINLTGLENLTTVGGSIEIYDNIVLMSLTGIDNIEAESISDYLYISYNSSLSTCEVQSVCDYIALPGSNVGIYDNAPGCNSEQEVEDACLVKIDEPVDIYNDIQIFPNPAKNEISISCQDGVTIKEINLYNQIGQKVIHKKQITHTIDVSLLRQGMYIIEIEIDNVKYRSKLMIE